MNFLPSFNVMSSIMQYGTIKKIHYALPICITIIMHNPICSAIQHCTLTLRYIHINNLEFYRYWRMKPSSQQPPPWCNMWEHSRISSSHLQWRIQWGWCDLFRSVLLENNVQYTCLVLVSNDQWITCNNEWSH